MFELQEIINLKICQRYKALSFFKKLTVSSIPIIHRLARQKIIIWTCFWRRIHCLVRKSIFSTS